TRLEQYPELAGIASAVGVSDLQPHPRPEGKRLFQGKVADAKRAQATGLGPRLTVADLATGDQVELRLLRDTENPAGHRFTLSLERTGKSMTIPFATSLLTPAAIPPLSLDAYPALASTLASVGAGRAADEPGGQWHILDPERALAAGLGLDRPPELRLLTRSSLPSPSELITSFPVLWSDRNLPQAIWLTLSRILQGFGWAILVALPLGLFMGAFTRIGVFFDPLRLTGMYIPLPALIPLTIAWVGIGEPQIVLFLAICMGVVLLPFVVASVQGVPAVYLDTARTLGASRGQIFRYVLVAISWPTLYRGLKISFAVGWTWIMLAEVIGVSNGLGYIINTSQRRGYIEHVYIVIALVIAMAFLSNAVWNLLSRLFFPYQENEN
ncbi:MAG: ABC transporter permease subunit, partial [Chromatiaceae bacterium]|nr:ABC transporter permease subunit [Chromatiaceae bacterium]